MTKMKIPTKVRSNKIGVKEAHNILVEEFGFQDITLPVFRTFIEKWKYHFPKMISQPSGFFGKHYIDPDRFRIFVEGGFISDEEEN